MVTTTDWSKYLAAHHSSSCLHACVQWEQTKGGRLQRYHTFKAVWRVNRQSQSTVIYTFEPADFRNICKCCLHSFIHSFIHFLSSSYEDACVSTWIFGRLAVRGRAIMVSKETANAQCFALHPISAPRQAQTSGSSLPSQHLVEPVITTPTQPVWT